MRSVSRSLLVACVAAAASACATAAATRPPQLPPFDPALAPRLPWQHDGAAGFREGLALLEAAATPEEVGAAAERLEHACLSGHAEACAYLERHWVRATLAEGMRPGFSPEAVDARASGQVRLRCRVEADGTAGACQVLRGLPYGITASVLQAVPEARFTPASLAGKPAVGWVELSNRLTFPGAQLREARERVERFPGDVDAWRHLTAMEREHGSAAAGEAALARALSLRPDDGELLVAWARACLAAGRAEEALGAAARATHASRGAGEAHAVYVEALAAGGRACEAASLAARLLALPPGSSEGFPRAAVEAQQPALAKACGDGPVAPPPGTAP
jgi:tetratricopeptide (TPR) repeat protein